MTTTTTAGSTDPRYARTLPRTAQSVGAARTLVRTALSAWGIDDLADAAVLLVSELVTNSVRHARCHAVRVTVTRTGQGVVRVAVVDRSHNLPVVRSPGSSEVCGRGLLIVAALTARWGIDPLPWGKRVWGELTREASR